jgi:putative endonuclease
MVIPVFGITIVPFYTYVLHCSNGSLYTGWTSDLNQRIENHNAGKGAKYTRANRPVKLAVSWVLDSKVDAMRLEWKIKHMNRAAKLRLISDPSLCTNLLADDLVSDDAGRNP